MKLSYWCDICGYRLTDPIIIKNAPQHTYNCYESSTELRLTECAHCGAVILVHPPPSEDWATVYRSIGVSPVARERKKAQLRVFLDQYFLHGKHIVELGAGNGQILDLLREIGESNIAGIEAGLDNVRTCEVKGHTMYATHFPVYPRADVLICSYHLEHYEHPTWIMHRIHDILNPGGVALIEVPNYDWIEAHGMWKELTRDHRYYYTSRTLELLVRKCGLYPERQVYPDELTLCVIARRRRAESPYQLTYHPGLASLVDKMNEEVDNFIQRTALFGAYAVYGAGHYAQMLLHQVAAKGGLLPEIIFDSNPAKQGQDICSVPVCEYTPKRALDYNAIVVMCGAYNDEVMEMLSGQAAKVIRWD